MYSGKKKENKNKVVLDVCVIFDPLQILFIIYEGVHYI